MTWSASGASATSADTAPVIGSHDSAPRRPTRKAALVRTAAFDVFATKYTSANGSRRCTKPTSGAAGVNRTSGRSEARSLARSRLVRPQRSGPANRARKQAPPRLRTSACRGRLPEPRRADPECAASRRRCPPRAQTPRASASSLAAPARPRAGSRPGRRACQAGAGSRRSARSARAPHRRTDRIRTQPR